MAKTMMAISSRISGTRWRQLKRMKNGLGHAQGIAAVLFYQVRFNHGNGH